MSVILDKVNTVPIINDDFTYEFKQWCSNTVDSINEISNDIEDLLVSIEVSAASGTPIPVNVNSLYMPSNSSLQSYQLPLTTHNDIGSIVEIDGQGAGGWRLLTAAGQTIQLASTGAVASTSISSSSRYDVINIILVASSTWNVRFDQTTGFVIV